MQAAALLERGALPLDRARRRTLALALEFGPTRALVSRREPRIAAQAALSVLVSLALTAVAPAFLFVATPLIFGVPHVAADVRYLVVRRGLPRWMVTATLAACVALFSIRFADWMRLATLPWARIELFAAELWIGAAITLGAARARSLGRFLLGAALLLTLGHYAQKAPSLARLVFAHAHNLVGIAIWIALFRRRRAAAGPAIAIMAFSLALVFAGLVARMAFTTGGLEFAGQDLSDASRWMAPGLSPELALSVTLAYVFLQSVHYSVWLGWIPQEDVRAAGTISFRMTARSLVRDFGGWLWVLAALAAGVALAPLWLGAVRARDAYLTLATFHGYLELAMLGFFAMGSPKPRGVG